MIEQLSFDHWLCRASSFHKLVTEPKLKSDKEAGNLSQTTKTYLRKVFREIKYERREEFESKHTKKGKLKENDAITLVSRKTKLFYKKNVIRISNHYVTGEPDIYEGEKLVGCKIGGDVKCSWSIFTFPFKDDPLDPSYHWQNKVYLYLTGAKEWYTHYCLVNAPDTLILNEKKSLWFKLDCPEDESNENYEEYIDKCIEIEKNLIFDMAQFKKDHPYFNHDCKDWHYDIPMADRVISFKVDQDEGDEAKIKDLVTKARNYLNELAKTN